MSSLGFSSVSSPDINSTVCLGADFVGEEIGSGGESEMGKGADTLDSTESIDERKAKNTLPCPKAPPEEGFLEIRLVFQESYIHRDKIFFANRIKKFVTLLRGCITNKDTFGP